MFERIAAAVNLRRILRFTSELLPARCCLCGARGGTPGLDLCADCADALPWSDIAITRTSQLNAVLAPLRYEFPVDQLVRALKYRGEAVYARVLGELLARKIRMFELVIGELDLILGNLEGAKSFEDLLRQAWESSDSEADLAVRMDTLANVLTRARQIYERVRESNFMLDESLDSER